MTADDAADDAVRYLANFHALAAVTCFVGSLVVATFSMDDFLQGSSASWLRTANAPALLLLATGFFALAYGGYKRRPWGWVLALVAYVGAFVAAIGLGIQGFWKSWAAVPAAAFMVFILLTRGVRRVHDIMESSP